MDKTELLESAVAFLHAIYLTESELYAFTDEKSKVWLLASADCMVKLAQEMEVNTDNPYTVWLRAVKADLSRLTAETLEELISEGGDVTHTSLAKLDLKGVDLSGAVLYGVSFNGSDLSGASLAEADLTEATFRGTNIKGADFTDVIRDIKEGA